MNKLQELFRLAFLGTTVSLAGCAGIVSTPALVTQDQNGNDIRLVGDGLIYYLPKKDFLVTIVKTAGAISSVVVDTSDAYPDLQHPYVLNNGTNLIGKNQADIGVGTNGLLKSSRSIVTSGVSDALKNLAESAGVITAAKADQPPPADCADGTHTFLRSKAESFNACGLTVNIAAMHDMKPPLNEEKAAASKNEAKEHSGLFYRQAEPYLVSVTGNVKGSIHTAKIVYTPSFSKIRYLPISRVLFATNDSTMEFTDGMPTKVNETRDGEVVGLLKLPATVIGAYFTAIGGVFTNLKDKDDKEALKLVSELKLELAKKKYEACIAAIKAGDNALVTSLECGK